MKLDLQKIREFGKLNMYARQLVEGFITGLHKSPYHGFSVEFAEHRLYNPGETTKNIDWKVYARTDRLYTKRYEEETNLRCLLLVDHSSSMFYPEATRGKITFSLMAAAALAYILQKQRDAVGLGTFSNEIEIMTQVKSSGAHLQKLFIIMQNLLAETPARKKTSIPSILHEIANKIHKRSLVILFTDMFDNADSTEELFNSLLHLKHNLHEILVFHITDHPTELHFRFDDRPYIFIDLETSEKLKIHPSEIREEYSTRMRMFHNEIKMKCGQYKIDYVEADINEDFNKILISYLTKRTKMK